MAKNILTKLTLNDGTQMPLFGLGLYLLDSGKTAQGALEAAAKIGYRLFDTAQFYQNETDLGKFIKNCGIPREEIYVVSKVWDSNHGYNKTTESVNQSISKLGLSYVDLFLIHSPNNNDNIGTYKALLDLKAKGLLKSVGVSNFGVQHLEGLKEAGFPTPSVNQFELNPFCKRTKLVKYCQENGIAVMGYCPLARGQTLKDPDLVKMAIEHKKTPAQVMLRWAIEKDYITIPKSSHNQRILENSQIFDFNLTKENLHILDSKPDDLVISWNPTVLPWKG